jgi:ubiquinone/menaquinone biosynthesis C-methylase UbiE
MFDSTCPSAESLRGQTQRYWRERTDALHRHSSEEWFKKYAAEVQAMLPRGGVLLDAGCGACQLTAWLAHGHERVHALDLSESMLAAARGNLARYKIDNVILYKAAVEQLPTEIASADVVLAYGVVQYLDQAALRRFLGEVRRVLSPSGIACLGLVPNVDFRRRYHLGLTHDHKPSSLNMANLARRMWNVYRIRRQAERDGNLLWDGIGRWFSKREIREEADTAGFDSEIRQAWFYEYRFHVLLTPRPDKLSPGRHAPHE